MGSEMCIRDSRAISTLQVRGQDAGDYVDLNAASGDCMDFNVESLDDDYFLHPDTKSLLVDTGQDHLKPKSTLNPSKTSKSVELNEDDVTIATYDPSQSVAVPITPLRTIATTSQTEEDEDWWEDWSIKSLIEALDVD